MITLDDTSDEGGVLKALMPDLTPMLDILFILLVFFMLAVGQVFQTMDLTLPQSAANEQSSLPREQVLVLSMGQASDSYAINDRKLEGLEAFKAEILKAVQENPEHKIVLAGDRNVSLERLLSVLTFLNDNGVQTANILMQSGENK